MKESDILYEVGNYWITNEGTKQKPSFHVWKMGVTHSVSDSAYSDLSLAIARANYLNKRNPLPL